MECDCRYYVYKHTSPSNKIYIGITQQNPEKRWQCGAGYSGNIHFINAIKKYGWKNFTHEILFSGLTEEEAKAKEIELIAYYDSTDVNKGYNISPGGSVITEEMKRKTKETRKQRGITERESKRMIALWEDPEFRERTLSNMRGKHRTEEQKEHYRASSARKGKPLPEETKEKLRQIRKLQVGEKSSRAKAVCKINPVDGSIVKVYPTARQAAVEMGNKSISAISNMCRGENGSKRFMHGYYWCYEKDYDSFVQTIELNPEITENGKLKRKPEESFWFGKTIPDENKEIISAAHRKSVMCIETGTVYKSLREAAKANGMEFPELISRQIRGKIKTAGGLTWKYVEEDIPEAELIEEAKLLGDS